MRVIFSQADRARARTREAPGEWPGESPGDELTGEGETATAEPGDKPPGANRPSSPRRRPRPAPAC